MDQHDSALPRFADTSPILASVSAHDDREQTYTQSRIGSDRSHSSYRDPSSVTADLDEPGTVGSGTAPHANLETTTTKQRLQLKQLHSQYPWQ